MAKDDSSSGFPHRVLRERFPADRAIRRGTLDGRHGVFITVRLTNYRSLPLSCIEGITLVIDGVAVDPNDIRLIIEHVPYALEKLTDLSDRWWFILDFAEMFAPLPDLSDGLHLVEAVLITVEPCMTAGRFSMFNPDERTLAPERPLRPQLGRQAVVLPGMA